MTETISALTTRLNNNWRQQDGMSHTYYQSVKNLMLNLKVAVFWNKGGDNQFCENTPVLQDFPINLRRQAIGM